MKYLVFIILSIGLTQVTPSLELVKEKEGVFKSVDVDEFGGVYLVSETKVLMKLDSALDTLYSFESKNIEVDYAATQNPLKILVFNKSLNSIVFLDKTLSASSEEFSLDELGLPSVKAVGMSRDNNVWVYDDNMQELKKFNTQLEQISTSGNVLNLSGVSSFPFLLKEQVGRVYAADSVNGVLEFDFFGSYLRTINAKVKGDFYVVENNLLFLDQDSLVVQDMLLSDQKKIGFPVQGITDFAYSKDCIFLLTKEKLHIYRLPL